MKKTLYFTCGKKFGTLDEARAYVLKTYAVAIIRDGMGEIREANWAKGIRDVAAGRYKAVPSSGKTPASFSLRDAMPPVYDQASRGTCAANAGAALVEYYEGCRTRLSVQYLFERMKREERDAHRRAAEELLSKGEVSDPEMADEVRDIANKIAESTSSSSVSREAVAGVLLNARVNMEGGSHARYVFGVLEHYGICSYDMWPYAREQLDMLDLVKDSTHGQMPPGADADAKRHRLNDEYYIFPVPNNVEEIKNYLSGARRWKPMPVFIGVKVFVDENGPLPLDGCVVRMPKLTPVQIQTATFEMPGQLCKELDGAVVDPDTVKDVESIEVVDMQKGGGHAMLLVGYEDDESMPGGGAFIVRNSWGGEWGDGGYGKLPYAYVELFAMDAATILVPKDVDGESESTQNDHDVPEELKPYLQTAVCDMKDRSGKWRISKGTRVIVDDGGVAEPDTVANRRLFLANGRSWSSVHVSTTCGAPTAHRVSAQGRLFSGVESAFSSLSRAPLAFPLLGGVTNGGLFGSRPKADRFAKVADLTLHFGDPLAIYEASGGKFRFRIAVASVRSPSDVAARADSFRKELADYAKTHRFEVAQYTIMVLETLAGGAVEVVPFVAENEALLILDGWTPDCGWHVSVASCGDGGTWSEWLRRLAPNTPAQWSARLAKAWDDIAVYGGHVTLGKMASALSIGPAEVAALVTAFLPAYKVAGDKVVKS